MQHSVIFSLQIRDVHRDWILVLSPSVPADFTPISTHPALILTHPCTSPQTVWSIPTDFLSLNNINITCSTALCPRLPGWASTREVKPVWIEQEIVSGSGISWAICKSAPCCRQITTRASHNSVFYRPDALPATQPTASKHWMQSTCHWTKGNNKVTILAILKIPHSTASTVNFNMWRNAPIYFIKLY